MIRDKALEKHKELLLRRSVERQEGSQIPCSARRRSDPRIRLPVCAVAARLYFCTLREAGPATGTTIDSELMPKCEALDLEGCTEPKESRDGAEQGMKPSHHQCAPLLLADHG